MLKTEFSPLISKSSNKKCILIRCLSMLVLCVIGAFLCYHYSSILIGESSRNLFLTENASNWYPTQEEIDNYRSKTVVIEYSMFDLPESADFSDLDSDIMIGFHNNLIIKHGYNWNDYNIDFIVMDDDKDNDDILSDDITYRLQCGSMYTMSIDPGFLELNCDSNFKSKQMTITGCVSYEHDTNGVRWGETGIGTSDCATNAVDSGLTLLTGRCCRARGGDIILTTSYWNATASISNGFCLDKDCNSGDTALGCGGTSASGLSGGSATFSGLKRTQDDRTGLTGCKAQRSTAGYLSVSPYCGILNDGALKCRTSYGSKAETTNGIRYVSRASCPVTMKMTDCDNEIKREINNCDAQSVSEDYGTNYGGFIEKRMCVAVGDTQWIVAIATCCEIE